MTRTSLLSFCAALLAGVLASCVPWTVRPIGDDHGSGAATVDPAAYVESIWSTRLVPAILGSAVDLPVLLDAQAASPSSAREKFGHRDSSGSTYYIVKGTGRVLAAETRSRNGLLLVDASPFDGRPDLSIQIGPVLRGTSLRDATGIVRFTDFVNQLQFADVANALNARVLKTVLAQLAPSALPNRSIEFAGTASPGDTGQPPVRDLVPVLLAVQEGR